MAETGRPRAANQIQAGGVGLVVAVIVGVLAGWLLTPIAGVLLGIAAFAAAWALVRPPSAASTPRAIGDPFTLSEPWRQFVQSADRSRRAMRATVAGVKDGPTKERLGGIVGRVDEAVIETWSIARGGDEIDAAVKRIDPVRLRSRLATLTSQSASGSGDVQAAARSVESQLQSADRLKALSASTADRLRLTQARLDELVARAAEVSIGASDPAAYAHDVDELADELEALRLAVAEISDVDGIAAGRVIATLPDVVPSPPSQTPAAAGQSTTPPASTTVPDAVSTSQPQPPGSARTSPPGSGRTSPSGSAPTTSPTQQQPPT